MNDRRSAFAAKVDPARGRVVLVGNRAAFQIGLRLVWMAILGAVTRREGIDLEFGEVAASARRAVQDAAGADGADGGGGA